jgi:hypothetical protein
MFFSGTSQINVNLSTFSYSAGHAGDEKRISDFAAQKSGGEIKMIKINFW